MSIPLESEPGQASILQLQLELKHLHHEIEKVQASLITLHYQVAIGKEKLDNHLAPYEEKIRYLQQQIVALQPPVDDTHRVSAIQPLPPPTRGDNHAKEKTPTSSTVASTTPMTWKQELGTIASWLLAMGEEPTLHAKINTLIHTPGLTLGEVLQQIPWGIIWEERAGEETVNNDLYSARLLKWRRALVDRHHELQEEYISLSGLSGYKAYHAAEASRWQDFVQDFEMEKRKECLRLEALLSRLSAKPV